MDQKIISITAIVASLLAVLGYCKEAEGFIVTSPLTIYNNSTMVWQDGRVLTNSATGSACPSTSYTETTNPTTSIIRVPVSTSSLGCARLYFEFNIDLIPTDATISQIQLKYNVTSVTNARNCDYMPVTTASSRSATPANLWTDLGDGSAYVSNDSGCTSTGSHTLTLGAGAITDLTSQLSATATGEYNHWFGVGVKMNSETRDTSDHQMTFCDTGNSVSSCRPQLIVTFTTSETVYVIEAMTEDGVISTNSATGTACPTTSYSKSTSGSSALSIRVGSTASNFCSRGYWEYDISAITTSITTVTELIMQDGMGCNSVCKVWSFYAVENQPSTNSASEVFTDCGNGTKYINSNDYGTLTIAPQDLPLPAQAKTDFASFSLSGNWFGICVKIEDEVRDANTHINSIYPSESTTIQHPRLIIKYTVGHDFSETLTVTGANTKALNSTKTESLSLSGAFTELLSKTFAEGLTLTEGFIKNPDKIFSESVIVAEGLTKELNKAYQEALTIFDEFTYDFESGFNAGSTLGSLAGGILLIAGLIAIFPLVVIAHRRRRN